MTITTVDQAKFDEAELDGVEESIQRNRLTRQLLFNPLFIIGSLIILIYIIMALFAPQIVPGPRENHHGPVIPRDGLSSEPRPPGSPWKRNAPRYVPAWYRVITGNDEWVHLWGTSSGQYDIFYGIVWGARSILTVGVIVVLISSLLGLIIGGISGYYGGWVDVVIIRIIEIFSAIPLYVAILILTSFLIPRIGQSIWPAAIALIVFGWAGTARMIRGDVLAIRERDFVQAAQALGGRDRRIIFQHVVPNAIYPSLIRMALRMGAIGLTFSVLSFIGVGAPENEAEWGNLIDLSRNFLVTLDQYWWTLIFPATTLILYGVAWNLIGDAIRDAFDPKQSK